jgi:DNA-binding Lrp family transcriptional regulator
MTLKMVECCVRWRMSPLLRLDAADARILEVLRRNGRIPNARLASEVGLSPSACLRRLHQLEHDGVIRGYTALIDEPSPRGTTTVIVQITLEKQSDDFLRRFEAAVKTCAEVTQCDLMTGDADYLLRVEAANAADYERIHTEVLSRLPGVARIQSNFTIRRVVAGR